MEGVVPVRSVCLYYYTVCALQQNAQRQDGDHAKVAIRVLKSINLRDLIHSLKEKAAGK